MNEPTADRTMAAVQVINARRPAQGEMRAHWLAYYAQAWSLAWDGCPNLLESHQSKA